MAQTQTPAYREVRADEVTLDALFAADAYSGDIVIVGTIPMMVVRDVDYSVNPRGTLSPGKGEVWLVPQTAAIINAGDTVYWNADASPYNGTANTGAASSTPTAYPIGTAAPLQPNGTNATTATDEFVRVLPDVAKRAATIGGAVTASDITGEDSSLGIVGLAGNAGAGGAIPITGGAGDGNAAGGAVGMTGGAGAGTGDGGAVSAVGGASGDGASSNGGAITITGGAATNAASGDGGAVSITGGAGPTVGNTGGAVTILSGAGDGTNGTAGAVTIDSSGTGATKGAITIGTNAASLTLGKMPRVPVAAVAATGSAQGDAGALSEGVNIVSDSDNTKGVILPSCVDGAQCVVVNLNTDKTLEIYPPTGKQVNNAGANNAITVAANTIGHFYSEGANAWYGLHAATDVA